MQSSAFLAAAVVLALVFPRSAPAQTTQSRPAATAQDRIVLKSGRSLVGTIGEDGGRALAFRDVELGELQVDRTRVRAVLPAGTDPGIYGLEGPPLTGVTLPESHVRFRAPAKGKSGSLQTAVTRWHHADTDTTLFLVAAVHVGEAAYFGRLQRILDATDVVLFEGVGRGKDGKEISKEDLERFDILMKLQLALKDALGLEFQKDGIDYGRSFWKNADLDFGTLTKEMAARGVSLPTDNPLYQFLLKLMLGALDLAEVKGNQALAKQLRRQTAPVLGNADRLLAGKAFGGLRSVLIDLRNEATMTVLGEELAAGPRGRWISVFYGAGHMPDFQKRLVAGGWRFQGIDWLDGWIVE